MLWFDNDVRTPLPVKVERAADYYRRKYGLTPTVCLVHPSMLGNQAEQPGKETQIGRLALRTSRVIMPGHLWIGVEDQQ
jgi:hypothetical protein